MCHKYYGIEVCYGTRRRQDLIDARRQRRPRNDPVQREARLQHEEEERQRVLKEKRERRREKCEKLLEEVTMIVSQEDLHAPRDGMEACIARNGSVTDNGNHLLLQLRATDEEGHPRNVADNCAICLTEYEVGDLVIWSNNPNKCQHAFHKECILMWLSKGKKRCPCCRQFFVKSKSPDDGSSKASAVVVEEGSDSGPGSEEGEGDFQTALDIRPSNDSGEEVVAVRSGDEESGLSRPVPMTSMSLQETEERVEESENFDEELGLGSSVVLDSHHSDESEDRVEARAAERGGE